ncbi:MAG: hypothetical protein OEQ47_16945 [Acidimicrobiia bacterium]|nr:hypothetical protein [Acidimicrobiia bacterium]
MRGRPVIGVIGGLVFGIGLTLVLQQAGIYPLKPLSVYGLPILGVVLGLVMARMAPLGGGER